MSHEASKQSIQVVDRQALKEQPIASPTSIPWVYDN